MKRELVLKDFADAEIIERIYIIRGHKVMLDFDLSELYGVETKRLKEQVRRNKSRFPEDFMFELTPEEYKSLRSQIATLKRGEHTKYLPFAFTEQGVAMLSSILHSETAIQVNIQIIRVYTKMRQLLPDNKELWHKIEALEMNLIKKDDEIQAIFKILKQLLIKEEKPGEPIGFKIPQKK